MVLKIPTINDKSWDFDQLFGLWNQANHDNLDIMLDFSGCGFLRQNAVAFLGGMIRLVESRGGRVQIDHATLREDVRRNLTRNRFLAAFGGNVGINPGNSIPYREDRVPDETGLTRYLRDDWLGKGGVHVSDPLCSAIVGTVWEIYANAFEHADSKVGILSCGQQFPRLRTLELTIVDFGLGVPANVRTFFSDPTLRSENALEWAFRPGTTTKPNGIGRGLGLDILKQFIRLNNGRLEVFSHNAYASIDSKQETYLARQTSFHGTLVNISLMCDESHYCLSSEVSEGPLF